MKTQTVNLNQQILVKLTDEGREYLEARYDEIIGDLAEKYPYTPPEEIDGWAKFQLWDFMGKFGEFCLYPEIDLPFGMEIKVILE